MRWRGKGAKAKNSLDRKCRNRRQSARPGCSYRASCRSLRAHPVQTGPSTASAAPARAAAEGNGALETAAQHPPEPPGL